MCRTECRPLIAHHYHEWHIVHNNKTFRRQIASYLLAAYRYDLFYTLNSQTDNRFRRKLVTTLSSTTAIGHFHSMTIIIDYRSVYAIMTT